MIILEVNNRKITGKYPNFQKLNNTLLNKLCLKESHNRIEYQINNRNNTGKPPKYLEIKQHASLLIY